MMAGINRAFGWKPIGRYENSNTPNLTIDPLPCTFDRTVMMVYDFVFASVADIKLVINGSAVSHYYTTHAAGVDGGVTLHTAIGVMDTYRIILSKNTISCLGSISLLKVNNNLHLTGSCVYYRPASNTFCNQDIGGMYTGGDPTKFEFYYDGVVTFTGHVQFFESVYTL